jgi:hypothetical protein
MIWSVAEAMDIDYAAWVKLYQSRFFKDDFPEETAKFRNVVFTDSVPDDRDASLERMRRQMIEDTHFDAAVFIGGMKGLLSEYEIIGGIRRSVRMIPLASTGGAARVLNDRYVKVPELESELDYVALLYRLLEVDPNELRYLNPDEQPPNLADRTDHLVARSPKDET